MSAATARQLVMAKAHTETVAGGAEVRSGFFF